MIVDELAKIQDIKFKTNKPLHAKVAEINIKGEKVILAKPTTFMNKSGDAVTNLMNHFNVPSHDTWIIYDDINLDFGTTRIRTRGSAGGHNGIKSILNIIKTDDFIRIRIGISEPPEKTPLEAYVLQKFSKNEQTELPSLVKNTASHILTALESNIEPETIQNA